LKKKADFVPRGRDTAAAQDQSGMGLVIFGLQKWPVTAIFQPHGFVSLRIGFRVP